jgi:hypothetical protein
MIPTLPTKPKGLQQKDKETMANPNQKAAASGAKEKAKRVLGPRTVYVMFKPGTAPEIVAAAREHIQTLTMNGRVILDRMGTGETIPPFLKYTVEVKERQSGDE